MKKSGFTIVETLVAVAILMIAIAGPLTIVNKSLRAAMEAQDQVTAAYLAQDVIETPDFSRALLQYFFGSYKTKSEIGRHIFGSHEAGWFCHICSIIPKVL
jgi:hypothetical protein